MNATLRAAAAAIVSASASFVPATAGPPAGARPPVGKPNIIVILADDLGWGDLSCYPQDPALPDARLRTPNIDSLAAEGARCTQGYATCMVCTPSRVGLLTGRYQQRIGWYGFAEAEVGLPDSITILPQFLKSRGYVTACIGKWHVGYKAGKLPLAKGFDRFYGFTGGQHDYFVSGLGQAMTGLSFEPAFIIDQEEPVKEIGYLTDELTKRAVDFIDAQAKGDKPFFLYLPYNAPHPPMQAKWETLKPYADGRGGRFNSRDICRAMIDDMDKGVGQVLNRLMHRGIDRDTLVIFTSDNGGHDDKDGRALVQHNGGLRPRKGFFWEGGIRVPFIVRWPGHVPEGLVYNRPVSQLDIYATIVAATGGTPPRRLDGVDLVPYLAGAKTDAPHEWLFWSMEKQHNRWAARRGDWKLAHEIIDGNAARTGGADSMELGLYNLADDPNETKNLAKERPEVVKELESLRDKFYETALPSILTPELRKKWTDELKAAKAADPNAESLRRDGAPGHWLGKPRGAAPE